MPEIIVIDILNSILNVKLRTSRNTWNFLKKINSDTNTGKNRILFEKSCKTFLLKEKTI